MSRELTRYARRVERAWAARHDGSAPVLSPREWRTIERWHEAGVPLAAVEEAIEETRLDARGRKTRTPPRRLSVLEERVLESWQLVRAGRTASSAPATAETQAPGSPLRRWQEAIHALDGPLAQWLGTLLDEARGDVDPAAIDERLDRGLAERVAPELRERAVAQATARLAGHRGRMSAEAFRRTRDRAVARELRRALRLPRLSVNPTATDRTR